MLAKSGSTDGYIQTFARGSPRLALNQDLAAGVSVWAWASHLVLPGCRTQTVRELSSKLLTSGLVSALQVKLLRTRYAVMAELEVRMRTWRSRSSYEVSLQWLRKMSVVSRAWIVLSTWI